MFSKSIYSCTIPYFYIIRNINSLKMYAGSRWAQGCNPNEFMIKGGYTTSSAIINAIIASEGIDSFEILRIDTYCDGLHVYEYESKFLQTIDCANNTNWYNVHNNDSILALGTDKFKQQMIDKYGCDHCMHLDIFKDKVKKTNIEKYGVEVPLQNQTIQEKMRTTNNNVNGDRNFNNRSKSINTCMEKYGVCNPSQSDIIKNKKIESYMSHYGVNNPSNYMFFSIIETKKTYAKNTLSRFFPQFKQYY